MAADISFNVWAQDEIVGIYRPARKTKGPQTPFSSVRCEVGEGNKKDGTGKMNDSRDSETGGDDTLYLHLMGVWGKPQVRRVWSFL